MTEREIGSRMLEIDSRLESLEIEIDRAERTWESLEYVIGEGAAPPRWLTEPYVDQE